MCRVALMVLLLAGVVQAGPTGGSWQAERWGESPVASSLPADYALGQNQVSVFAGATASLVDAYLITSLTQSDQEQTDSDKSTAWFGLKFVGSAKATGHRWKITSRIGGSGWAYAKAFFEASSWGESLQVIKVTGDNTNLGGGHLAVQDNAKVNLAISIPPSLSIAFAKAQRALTSDEFQAKNDVCTKGLGKACRVRVENTVEARGSACSTVQTATLLMTAKVNVAIEMVGSCKFAGVEVEDRFLLDPDKDDATTAKVTPPTGGIESGGDEVPTDQPTDEEREGEDEDGPTIDAKDLWKVLPEGSEDQPPVDSGASLEED